MVARWGGPNPVPLGAGCIQGQILVWKTIFGAAVPLFGVPKRNFRRSRGAFSSRLWTLNLKNFPEPRRERAAPRFGKIFKLRPPSGGATCPKGRNRAAKTMPPRRHTNSHQTAGWVTVYSIYIPRYTCIYSNRGFQVLKISNFFLPPVLKFFLVISLAPSHSP